MNDDMGQLAIREVAERAGMTASRIRYYEARGVLPAPDRVAGKRRYTPDVLRRLAIIGAASVRRLLEIGSECDCESIDVCRMFELTSTQVDA